MLGSNCSHFGSHPLGYTLKPAESTSYPSVATLYLGLLLKEKRNVLRGMSIGKMATPFKCVMLGELTRSQVGGYRNGYSRGAAAHSSSSAISARPGRQQVQAKFRIQRRNDDYVRA